MKLRGKLTILVAIMMILTLGVSGTFCIFQIKHNGMILEVENEKEKLRVVGNAFRQIGTKSDLEEMGELARDAYLKYQFRRCYQTGYALIRDGETLENLTDYEIVNFQAMQGEWQIQRVENEHVLILYQPLEYPEGFGVLAVRDISKMWDQVNRQAWLMGLVFLVVLILGTMGTYLCLRPLFASLECLGKAAEAIGNGKLGTKVAISGTDEVAQIGEVFNQMSQAVQEQVENLKLLLGALAHEMKTPLTAINGYAQTLLTLRLSEEQKQRSLEHIRASSMRMEQMSSKLLALVGLYENDAICRENVSVRALFREVSEEMRELLTAYQVNLITSCEEEFTILGDFTLLSSLLENLIHNSAKASAPGKSIRLSAHDLELVVEDEGCGMAKEELSKVTQAFYMVDKSRSRSQGGAGIGLALCERIAMLHGASLRIESTPGVGTRVTLTFQKEKIK